MLVCLPAPALAWDEAGYWDFADKLARRLDDTWNPELGRYRPGSSSVDSMMNANMLLLHSAAALRGHEGASRQDERARSIAAQLMNTPPWMETVSIPPPGSHVHVPGWVASMTEPRHRPAPGGRRRGHRRAGDGVAGEGRARASTRRSRR